MSLRLFFGVCLLLVTGLKKAMGLNLKPLFHYGRKFAESGNETSFWSGCDQLCGGMHGLSRKFRRNFNGWDRQCPRVRSIIPLSFSTIRIGIAPLCAYENPEHS